MAVFTHSFRDAGAEIVPLHSPLFVADAPEDDRRVVTVAADHTAEKLYMFVIHTGQTVLLYHKDSETVASVKSFRSHRVVARTVGIHSYLFEFAQSPFLKFFRDGTADSGHILMHVHAFELHRPSVEKEATVIVKGYMPDADGRFVCIRLLVIYIYFGHQCIEIWILT